MRDLLLASQQKPLSFWRSTSTSGWRNEPGQEPSTPGHHRKLSACRRTWEMTVVMTEKKCCVVIHPSVAMLLLSAEPCSPNWAKRFCRAESQQKPQRCSGGGEKPGCVGYLQRAGVSFPASVSSSKLQCSLCIFGGGGIDLESGCLSIYCLYAGHGFLLKKADTQYC